MGPGNEGSELKVSRAYIAGLGTTGVLIGSFLLLLTVGSALVAFQGVPGQATNGDLSSIELRRCAGTQFDADAVAALERIISSAEEPPPPAAATLPQRQMEDLGTFR